MRLPFSVLSVDLKAERDGEPIVNKIPPNNKIYTQRLNKCIGTIFKLKIDLWNIMNRDFNIYASEVKMTLADA